MKHLSGLLAGLGILLPGSTACSLLVDTSATQCTADAECAELVGPASMCVAGECSTPTGTETGVTSSGDGSPTSDSGPSSTTAAADTSGGVESTSSGSTSSNTTVNTSFPGGESETSAGSGDCIPTEAEEVTCDDTDNDCDGFVDNVDAALDGFCDCLNVGILGDTGYNPTANFVSWLEEQGTSVTRTTLANNPGVVTPELLANYDVLLLDRIERALSPEEAAAIEDFVKDGGFGLITLIGYNFDSDNPAPERDRANSVLGSFGLAYAGNYLHAGDGGGVTPTFVQDHSVSMGIVDVNFAGGMAPVDNGGQGETVVFATVPQGDAGLAHQTAGGGGRVVAWGDEWVTFDSDWQGYADVQQFWSQMLAWVRPADICSPPPS